MYILLHLHPKRKKNALTPVWDLTLTAYFSSMKDLHSEEMGQFKMFCDWLGWCYVSHWSQTCLQHIPPYSPFFLSVEVFLFQWRWGVYDHMSLCDGLDICAEDCRINRTYKISTVYCISLSVAPLYVCVVFL